jgi:hypothetical protein
MMLKSVVAFNSQTPKSASTVLVRPEMRTSELERLNGGLCGAGAGVGSMGSETKPASRKSSTSASPGGCLWILPPSAGRRTRFSFPEKGERQ